MFYWIFIFSMCPLVTSDIHLYLSSYNYLINKNQTKGSDARVWTVNSSFAQIKKLRGSVISPFHLLYILCISSFLRFKLESSSAGSFLMLTSFCLYETAQIIVLEYLWTLVRRYSAPSIHIIWRKLTYGLLNETGLSYSTLALIITLFCYKPIEIFICSPDIRYQLQSTSGKSFSLIQLGSQNN